MTVHSPGVIDTKLAAVLTAARAVLAERLHARGLREATAADVLSAAVRRVSLAYRREEGSLAELMRDRDAIDARLAFFLPRDLPKLLAPLRELAAAGVLPAGERVRVLDLGAGLGTSGFGAAAYLLGHGHARHVQVDAVDVDAQALAVAERIARELATAHRFALEHRVAERPLEHVLRDAESPRYDLIVLGLVLNEIDGTDPAGALATLCERLAPGGALIVLEPALRETSRALQRTRDAIASAGRAPYVFAPCLHARPCPLLERERDWCHERLPLPLPKDAAALARAAGLRDEDLTFSYLTLRNEPGSLASLGREAGVLYRVVGGPLVTKGKRELLVCGSDDARVLRRLDRKASDANSAIDGARRGSVMAVAAGDVAGPDRAIGAETNVRILHES
jgi:ribosomal protein RSM22 (predicted rRNA methylase)